MKRLIGKFFFDLFVLIAIGVFVLFSTESDLNFVKIPFVTGYYLLFYVYYLLIRYIIFIKFDKDKRIVDKKLSIFEPPNNSDPTSVSYLIREVVDLNIFYVVLLKLVNKRKMKIDKVGNDYEFTLLDKEVPLSKVDEFVLKVFFWEPGKKIKISAFKSLFESVAEREKLIKILLNIEILLKEDIAHFTEDNEEAKKTMMKKIIKHLVILSIVGFIVPGVGYFGAILSLIIHTGLSDFIGRSTRKTEVGVIEYNEWFSYAKFLKKRINSGEMNVQDIVLWDHHLTYALALGVAGNVLDELDWLNGNIVEVANGNSRMISFGKYAN